MLLTYKALILCVLLLPSSPVCCYKALSYLYACFILLAYFLDQKILNYLHFKLLYFIETYFNFYSVPSPGSVE